MVRIAVWDSCFKKRKHKILAIWTTRGKRGSISPIGLEACNCVLAAAPPLSTVFQTTSVEAQTGRAAIAYASPSFLNLRVTIGHLISVSPKLGPQ